VKLKFIRDAIYRVVKGKRKSFALQTFYNRKSDGRWRWLADVGPDGTTSGEWVILDEFRDWILLEGHRVDFDMIHDPHARRLLERLLAGEEVAA